MSRVNAIGCATNGPRLELAGPLATVLPAPAIARSRGMAIARLGGTIPRPQQSAEKLM